MSKRSDSKIHTLGLLRGFAVFSVCCHHLAMPLVNQLPASNPLNWIVKYGLYGVQVFFVISGFVIPYSLYRANYKINDYFKFLWKRLLRLHPPYLIALGLSLIIAFLSYKARNLPNPENVTSIIKSLFYLSKPADNPVFWTLKIEAEYYIFIGLFFTIMTRFPRLTLFIATPALLYLSTTPIAHYIELLQYIAYFLIGIAGFVIFTKRDNIIPEVILLGLIITFGILYLDTPAVIFATTTILIILAYKRAIPAILEWPGEISYSVYLIHFPIGVKLMNLLVRRVNPHYNWLLLILGVSVCFALGWVFWKFIEKPSARLSNKVKYGSRTPAFANFDLKD